jgi:uncharacterized protein (UPF0276 family)
MQGFPDLGCGLGLRPPQYDAAARGQLAVDWLEVVTENFMVEGGNPRRVLRAARGFYPIVLHGVSLSLGSVDPLDSAYLDRLAALAAEIEPAWISDHLCWSSFGGHTAHDLWPLPFTEEALDHMANRILRVQERLGRRILVENVSSYLQFKHSTMKEWEFIAALVERADCGVLLDVNNVYVSAHNHGFDAVAFIEGVPANRVGQLHVAGHQREPDVLLDTHDHPVADAVWSLLRRTAERVGSVSTLLERDGRFPPTDALVAEARRAADVVAAASGGGRARATVAK